MAFPTARLACEIGRKRRTTARTMPCSKQHCSFEFWGNERDTTGSGLLPPQIGRSWRPDAVSMGEATKVQYLERVHLHFSWQAQYFIRVVLRVFANPIVRAASSGANVQILWQE
eukprot:s4548_g1.t1